MVDPTFLTVVSELFVNLSAGWFGAALIVPVTSKAPKEINLWILTFNFLIGIFLLIVAFEFRQLVKP